MASVDSSANGTSSVNGGGLSAAQKLQQKHDEEAHKATIEEVPDEDDLKHGETPENLSGILEGPGDAPAPGWVPPMSAKAAGKRKEDTSQKENKPLLDTQSEDLFPGLGGAKPKPVVIKAPLWKVDGTPTVATNGTNGFSTNGTSTPTSGVNTPPSSTSQAAPNRPKVGIPRQYEAAYSLKTNEMLPRTQLKKPLPELLKDINKRSKANVTFAPTHDGITFKASGPKDAAMKALQDIVEIVGSKTTIKFPIPQSIKAFVIGKQGSKIKELQEKTGARIQVPKADDSKPTLGDDDDPMIDVTIEGNKLSVYKAAQEIEAIADERTPPINTKLRTIPAEYYPFIAGSPDVSKLESKGVRVQVPSYHTWTVQPPPVAPGPGQRPVFQPAAGDNHITLSGNRASVQEARAAIEALADELERQLAIDELTVERSRHQFIIGKPGMKPQEFFAETGCAIILPSDEEEDLITIIGPPERTQAARNRAVNLAGDMKNSRVDISRQHKGPGGGPAHARNVTQYLRQRRAIEQLEDLYQAHIVTAFGQNGGAMPWDVYSRDYNNVSNAQAAINSIVSAHPPSRFASIDVDPFYHKYLRDGITPVVKKDFGVHVVTPPSDADTAVLLVFEGDAGLEPTFEVPRGQPSPEEIRAFKQGLADAQKHILDIISAQAQIKSTSIDVPHIFHDKLRRYIKTQQQNRAADEIPVRVTNAGTVVTLKGPAPAVDTLAANVEAFVAQAIEDEKERGFTLTFDFPQKHANQLIGKGGSNIRELREKFDVEIKVDDGKVELKGPKAKAEAAKTHISALGRQWADEATYVLKIEPKYHRELIGAQGNVINKLQTRYNVQIHFPRSARPVKDDQSNADAASEAGGRKGGRREQEPDEVIVKGPKKGADGARDELLELLQYNKDNNHTASVTVQQSQIPSLIGQRGREMDLLRESTGARIDVPNAKDVKDPSGRVEIQIKGTKTQVAQAKKLLDEKKTAFDQTITKNLEVDKKHHSALIGAGGSTLRDIVVKAGGSDDRRELARTVQFPKTGSEGNSIKIEGNKDVVEKIVAAMQKIIAERDSQTVETIEVPTDKHRSLIGRGGEAKKDLESKFKVSIDIPRQGSGQTGVKIAGQPTNVEKAKIHILDLIKDQEGETIQVPRKVHHTIADNGQFFRKLRNDHQVTVGHAGSKVPPKPAAPANARTNGGALPLITDDADAASNAHSWNVVSIDASDIDGEIPWVLSGPPENVAKAKNTLAAAIEQVLNNTSTGYLVLPDPRTYRYVIGQGGSKVNSIRKATGCKITVPRDQAKDEAIEVSGSADGVEKAKELILKAVEEGRNNGANGSRS